MLAWGIFAVSFLAPAFFLLQLVLETGDHKALHRVQQQTEKKSFSLVTLSRRFISLKKPKCDCKGKKVGEQHGGDD